MKNKIDPSKLYWASFNRFELRLLGQCVLDCSHSGSCDADVDAWYPRVFAQIRADRFPNRPTKKKIRQELKEYGAWIENELENGIENFKRLIWCAANNIADEENPDCSEPVNQKNDQRKSQTNP